MIHVEPPCHGCERRQVGCHNVETCPEWKEYRERVEATRAEVINRNRSTRMTNYEKAEEMRQRNWQNHRLKRRLRRK